MPVCLVKLCVGAGLSECAWLAPSLRARCSRCAAVRRMRSEHHRSADTQWSTAGGSTAQHSLITAVDVQRVTTAAHLLTALRPPSSARVSLSAAGMSADAADDSLLDMEQYVAEVESYLRQGGEQRAGVAGSRSA